MAAPLKVGVAGLGTVGSALLAQVAHQREALSLRCGRRIEIVAVCARSKAKDRGVDLRGVRNGLPIRSSLRAIPASTCSSS